MDFDRHIRYISHDQQSHSSSSIIHILLMYCRFSQFTPKTLHALLLAVSRAACAALDAAFVLVVT
jgi:hypothetical protein